MRQNSFVAGLRARVEGRPRAQAILWLLALTVAGLCSLCIGLFVWSDSSHPKVQPQNRFANLSDQLIRLRWIAYSPTHFDPTAKPPKWPTENDVREDLRVLRQAGFDGLVTYASNYVNAANPAQMLDLAGLAQTAGFAGMIVGVWNPADEKELQVAVQAASHRILTGYCVGNEGLDHRYNLKTLKTAVERLRQLTQKPVTTTEEAHDYYENSPLWQLGDWTFPNVHPYFSKRKLPQEAVAWTEQIYKTLLPISNKPLIFKEVGLPSAGDDDLSEARQAEYYRLLRKTKVVFAVFEAFDAPWKHLGQRKADGTYPQPDPEPHWGIFTHDRKPKDAASIK